MGGCPPPPASTHTSLTLIEQEQGYEQQQEHIPHLFSSPSKVAAAASTSLLPFLSKFKDGGSSINTTTISPLFSCQRAAVAALYFFKMLIFLIFNNLIFVLINCKCVGYLSWVWIYPGYKEADP